MEQEWNEAFQLTSSKRKEDRSLAQSHQLEIKLKQKYEGIFKDSNHGNTIRNGSENKDISSDEDVDAYDEFAGDDILSETVEDIIEETIVSQSTNITGV